MLRTCFAQNDVRCLRKTWKDLCSSNATSMHNIGKELCTVLINQNMVILNPFNLKGCCREFTFSDSSDPYQKAAIGAIWSGLVLFENASRVFWKFQQNLQIIPRIQEVCQRLFRQPINNINPKTTYDYSDLCIYIFTNSADPDYTAFETNAWIGLALFALLGSKLFLHGG